MTTITNVTPLEGFYTGGTLVTITGTGFTLPPGGEVYFNGIASQTYTFYSPTLITAVTPSQPVGPAIIAVDGTGSVTYGTPFQYTDILPTSGLGLTVITIIGTDFTQSPSSTSNVASVIMNGLPFSIFLSFTVVSYTELTAIIPQGTNDSNGANVTFQIDGIPSPNPPSQPVTSFTYSLVTVTNFTPLLGFYTGGTLLTITGTNFTGPVNVTVGGINATSVTLVNSTTITAITPPGLPNILEQINVIISSPSTSIDIIVGFFQYIEISPLTGSEGTPITIAGANFICPLTVTIGGIEVSYTIYSSTELVAIAPAGTNGTSVLIVISGPSLPTSPLTLSTLFTYTLPSITSITPLTGIYLGGTPITIIGNNFSEPVIVTIEGNQATNIILTGSTLITAVTPQTFDFNNLEAVIVVNGVEYIQKFTYVLTYINSIEQYVTTPIHGTTYTTSPILIGPAMGGTEIVIYGGNFLNPIIVTIGGFLAVYTVINPNELVAIVPPGTSDTFVDIVVNGILYSKQYNYVTPTITSINPYEGPTAGGTQVVIKGTNFTYPPFVSTALSSFGGFTQVVFISSTTLIALTLPLTLPITPPIPTLPYTPTITIYEVNTNLFTYYNTGYTVTPNIVIVGNTTTTFTITGPNSGLTDIYFGNVLIPGSAYLPIVPGTTTITPPPGFISTVPIIFILGSTNTYVGTVTYINAIITEIIPPSGPLSGLSLFNFIMYSYDAFPLVTVPFAIPFPSTVTQVKIGLQYSTNVNFLPPYIICDIPPGVAGSLPLLLQDVASTTLATSEILFRYVGLPTITSFTPPNGLSVGGTSVVIKGTEFVGSVVTPVSVTVGGYQVLNLSVDSDTQLTFILPPKQPNATNTPPIIITTVGGSVTNIIVPFSYVNPRITGITPQSGSANGGTPITITGTNFSGPINVLLGPNNATNVVVVNSTTITAIAPRGTGTVALTVANATLTFSYTYIPPSITNVYPVSGSSLGGTPIIITGIYFTGATNVYINGVLASSVVVVSDTEITAVTPALTPPGPLAQPYRVPLVIEWPNNLTTSDFFTYDDTLLITSVYPSGGVTDGGTPIRINGIGFINPLSVTIGGNPVGNIVVDPTGTFITGTTPPGNIGRQDLIVVSNARTASAYFTYLYPLPQPPYHDTTCPGPRYNATNFTAANGPIYSTLQSYAKNSPNYPWDTGVNSQEIYRSQQNTVNFTSLNQQTIDVKNTNNRLITSGLAGNVPYPPFKSQADRLSYVQGLTLNASRNKITGQNPSAPMGVPCSTIYEIIYS